MAAKIIDQLPVFLFVLLAGIAAIALTNGKDPSKIETPLLGQVLPDFTIEGLSHTQIKGPAIISFFASWCAPCAAEHKFLMTLSETVKIYGISYKDSAEKRDAFLQRRGNPYALSGDDPDGKAAIAFGVYGVPTTFVINAENVIVYRQDSPLSATDIETIRGYLP